MEEDAVKLLRKIVDSKETSIYSLAQMWATHKKVRSEEVFDETVRIVYTLASQTLVELETTEGEDGTETVVKPTPFGETYIKSAKAKKD